MKAWCTVRCMLTGSCVRIMNELLHGKVKTVYDVDGDAGKVIIKFHDRVTAWNGKHVEYPEEKGKICCLISAPVSYTHLTLPTKA